MSEFQVIKNPAEARRLLKIGNSIVDIAPKKEYGKDIFIYKGKEISWKEVGGHYH